MHKHINKNKYLLCFLLILTCLFSFTSFNASAAPFDATTANGLYILETEYNTIDTYTAIFSYFDFLYDNNMTDGYKLMYIQYRPNNQNVDLFFADPQSSAAYMVANVLPSGVAAGRFTLYNAAGAMAEGYAQASYLSFGNFLIGTNQNSASSTFNTGYVNYYAYRGINGLEFSSSLSSGLVDPVVTAQRASVETFIMSLSGDTPNVVYQLNIGSIISALMVAPMTIFNGFFGFEIFGINIAGTLGAIIVIAIVIFIFKFLRGD